ncbi:hypothetical protein [Sulfitobacter dubius]|uniref:hypothetical protein n=1 Tax=Sulfitobacter dubius TaxID=218673 RepID=UPI002941CC42|nr:hypothetical protein [Sulfitobacter dubius]WOI30064.1 hypothetical protein R1T39_04995 [Sulfitobacter dubius]
MVPTEHVMLEIIFNDTENLWGWVMSFQLIIDAEEETLSLKVSGFNLKDRAPIQARLAEVAELLEEILSSDEAANSLTDAELTRLTPSLAALELKYKILMHQAGELAQAAKSIAQGHETISQHGFPELDDA